MFFEQFRYISRLNVASIDEVARDHIYFKCFIAAPKHIYALLQSCLVDRLNCRSTYRYIYTPT